MEEARRFLRYVTPGLAFVLEVLLLSWILDPVWIAEKLFALLSRDGIGVAIAALVGSGGVGYVLGMVHHAVHFRRNGPVRYNELIRSLIDRKLLSLVDARTNNPPIRVPDSRESWRIVEALLHGRISTNEYVKGSEGRTRALSDTMHSVGTARIASVVAPITAILIVCWHDSISATVPRQIAAVVVGLAVSASTWYSYFQICGSLQGIVEEIVCDALAHEHSPPTKTFVMYVSTNPPNRPPIGVGGIEAGPVSPGASGADSGA